MAGGVACLGARGSMVEHQPRLLGSRVRFPARVIGEFFLFLPKLHFQFLFPLSLSSFPSTVCFRSKRTFRNHLVLHYSTV